MFFRGYVEKIRASLALASAEPVLPTAARTVWVYLFTLGWVLVWWVAGPSRKPEHFFVEGGPIDWVSTVYLGTGALLAWLAWFAGRRRGEPAAWFWLASGVGLGFFAVDERLQLHEHILSDWQEPIFGPVPLGLRNWNDLVVIVYGLLALGLLVLALPAVLRYRGFRRFLVAGFVLYAVHTFLDAADDYFGSHPVKEMAEEASKLLSGASLMLAYLQAALCRAAARTAASAPERPGVNGLRAAVLYALTLLLAWILLTGDPETLEHRWGDPLAWLTSLHLGIAAVMAWLATMPHPSTGDRRDGAGSRGEKTYWYVTAVFLAGLAFDQATVACAYRFEHRWVRDSLPAMLTDGAWVLQRPLGLPAVATVVVLVLLAVLGRRALGPGRSRRFLAVAAVLFVALVPLGLLWPRLDEAPVSQVVLLLACVSLALAAFNRVAVGISR